jgi:type I restriction enzyme R subunit
MLEQVRRRLRNLVRLIEKQQRKLIYTNFEDLLGSERPIVLPGFAEGADHVKFRAKALAFLRDHEDHVAIQRLWRNKPLTKSDVAELERMFLASGVGDADDINRAKAESHGLGLFVRSLIGLDREAAKEALGTFLTGKVLGANQIDFVNLIIDHLTEHGVMEPAALYESPFTDLTPSGPEGLFDESQIGELISVLISVRERAAA